MRKDIFGQDSLIGTMRKIVPRGVFYPLSRRNIKHQKLKVKFL
jgi:hypothetical protein